MTDRAPDAAAAHAEVAAIVQAMQDAWNAGDGAAFTAPFTDDADFVNVYGMHARGRDEIRRGHEFILKGPYAGSVNRYVLESVRLPRPDTALAHVRATLQVPAGPLAGEHQARYSMVLLHDGGRWQVTAFHNTFVREPGPPR
ncbi:MAG TPA: SgcJ/EcaC family oxidoreductase [Longimicrobium sp.]|nr:SgcJ/EcaC family oxidoreductase [Longimicrobium sp.]